MTRPTIAPGLALAAILALATWLRLQGLGFGLPAVYNPDEIAIMSRALAFAKGDLNPHNFLYPTFYFYVLFAWIGVYFAGAWASGAVASAAAFQAQFFTDPTGIYLAGRTLGVVCGVATVAATFALGRRLFDTETGLVAACFLAVAPTAVRDAHYVKHDVPVTLAAVLAMLAIASIVRTGSRLAVPGSRKRTLVAAALCGVACSTHYYAVFLALPLTLAIVLAHATQGVRAIVRELSIAGVVAVAVFLALSPFLLVEPATAWQDIVANRQIVMDRAVTDGRGAFASTPAYARLLWTEAVGWPVLLAALAGLALVTRDRPGVAALLIAFPLPFLAFISNTVAASRYLNPVLPFVALLAAYAVVRLAGAIPLTPGLSPHAGSGGAPPWIIAGAAMLLAIPGLILSVAIGRFFQQTDTRTLAQRFIESSIPAGATILVQPYSVQLTQSKASLREALAATGHDPARPTGKFAIRLALDPEPSPAYRTLFLGDGGLDADKIYVSPQVLGRPARGSGDGLEPLRRLGVQYVVLKRYNTEDLPVAPLRAELRSQGRLLAEFSPWRPDEGANTRARTLVTPFLHNTDTPYDRSLDRPGPGIEVWSLTAQ